MHSCIIVCLLMCVAVFAATEENFLSDAYIERINSIQSSWKAGRNFDANTPLSNIKKLMGVKTDYVSKLPLKSTLDISLQLPESFDAREKWPNCPSISEIRDQANCGNCWAFGAVEAMSDKICIFSNGTQQVSLSVNDLTACCDICGFGCDGGYPENAWQYWIDVGIVSGGGYGSHEGCQSYQFPPCEHSTNINGSLSPCKGSAQTPTCTKRCDPSSSLYYFQDLHFGETSYSFNDVDVVRSEIFRNGPVEAAFFVYDDFVNYKSGVYQHTSNNLLGSHAVKILGWGVENDLPYWLVANSWNTDWGDKGYFKILRGSDECGIEDRVLGGVPKV
ncbi:hypothetical protein HHI36_018145 [Cryptolaemus montrouzieri]